LWLLLLLLLQVAPNYPIVRTNLAVALTDLGTALKLKGQLQQGIGGSTVLFSASLQTCAV
jgi:hypothetical protein